MEMEGRSPTFHPSSHIRARARRKNGELGKQKVENEDKGKEERKEEESLFSVEEPEVRFIQTYFLWAIQSSRKLSQKSQAYATFLYARFLSKCQHFSLAEEYFLQSLEVFFSPLCYLLCLQFSFCFFSMTPTIPNF